MGECFDVPLGRDETPEARRRPAQNDRRLDGVPRGIPPGVPRCPVRWPEVRRTVPVPTLRAGTTLISTRRRGDRWFGGRAEREFGRGGDQNGSHRRSEEHTSELQSLM